MHQQPRHAQVGLTLRLTACPPAADVLDATGGQTHSPTSSSSTSDQRTRALPATPAPRRPAATSDPQAAAGPSPRSSGSKPDPLNHLGAALLTTPLGTPKRGRINGPSLCVFSGGTAFNVVAGKGWRHSGLIWLPEGAGWPQVTQRRGGRGLTQLWSPVLHTLQQMQS